MERPKNRLKQTGVLILLLLHIVGLLGFSFPEWEPLFRWLTPFHLLINALVLWFFHPVRDKYLGLFLGVVILLGWGIEVIGVQTGIIFGAYTYGEILGWSPAGVPVLIGINWAMLTYAAGMVLAPCKWPAWLKSLLGGLLLIGYDWLLEPFAIQQGLWVWQGDTIPLQNYVAWWLIATCFLFFFYQLPLSRRNPLALPFLIIQGGFFLAGRLIGLWG